MNRRAFLAGLFAAPAIVAADHLMPLRGIVMPVLNHRWLMFSDESTDTIWMRHDVSQMPLEMPRGCRMVPERLRVKFDLPNIVRICEDRASADRFSQHGYDMQITGNNMRDLFAGGHWA